MPDPDSIHDVELRREAERIAPLATEQWMAVSGKVIFNGIQAHVGGVDFGVFTDRLTGASFCVEIGGDVMGALAAKRRQFQSERKE